MSPCEGHQSQVLRGLCLPMPLQVFPWFKRLGEVHLLSANPTLSVKEMQGLGEAGVSSAGWEKRWGQENPLCLPGLPNLGNEQMAQRTEIQAWKNNIR